MISLDTNLLLYSLNPASAWHSAAVSFLRSSLKSTAMQVVLTDYVLVELYVLLRNPAVMSQPLSAKAARDLVTAYWSIPTVMRVENAKVMDG
jgi:predicted nucleic acid-binding protein